MQLSSFRFSYSKFQSSVLSLVNISHFLYYFPFSITFFFSIFFSITFNGKERKKESPRKSWSKSRKREGGKHTIETERCLCSSEYQLAGLFGGCDRHDIMGSDSVGFKRTLLLQETLRCLYFWIMFFSKYMPSTIYSSLETETN